MTKHRSKPGITISPRPNMEKCPELWVEGNTNFPGSESLGAFLKNRKKSKSWFHEFFSARANFSFFLVMGRTPFYRTSIELEHHFSNIERTRTCSFVDDRTRTPYFWLRTIEHRTSNIVRPITNFKLLLKSFFFL